MKLRFSPVVTFTSLACLAAMLVAGTAVGQYQQLQSYQWQQREQRRNQREAATRQQMEALAFKLSGVVEAVAPGRIQVISGTGEAWLVQVMPQAEVEVRGTASPEFLAPGQFVSFVAKADIRRSKIDEKIFKLTIFTPDDEHMLGAFPEGPEAEGPAPGVPGGDPPGARQRPANAKAAAPNAKGAGRGAAPAEGTYELAGRITKVKNGELTVAVPSVKAPIRIELADQPEIEVRLFGANNHVWARKGDKIDIAGVQSPTGERMAQALKVTLDLVQPLGAAEERKPVRRPARAKGKAADQQEPAAAPQGAAQTPRGKAKQ